MYTGGVCGSVYTGGVCGSVYTGGVCGVCTLVECVQWWSV